MPIIPGADAQRNIKATPVAPMRDEASSYFEGPKNIIKTATNIVQQWSDANDVMQSNNAKSKFGMKLADIQARAAADPGMVLDKDGMPVFQDNTQKYLQEIQEAKSDALTGISNKMVSVDLNSSFSLDGEIAGFRIGGQFKKKGVDYSATQAVKEYTRLTGAMLSDTSEGGSIRSQARQDRDLLLRNNVLAGIISPEQAEKLENQAITTVMEFKVYSDNSTQESQSDLLRELQNPNSSTSKNLDSNQRIKLVKELTYRISRNAVTMKKESAYSTFVDRTDTIKKIASGEVRYDDPSLLVKMSETDPTMYNILKMIQNNNGQYPPELNRSDIMEVQNFRDAVVSAYKQLDTDSLNKYIDNTIANFKNTRGDVKKLGILTDVAIAQAESLKTIPDDPQMVDDHWTVRDTLEFIKMAIPPLAPFVSQDFLRRKFGRKISGPAIKEEGKKAVRDAVRTAYPQTNALDGIPNVIMDENGLAEDVYYGPNELDGEEYAPTTSESVGSDNDATQTFDTRE
jgi:hypothetical protein